ncbi:hypothetical protein IWW34DRAFT_785089 [Fusarium oxysporum f. sp. albedinis]|nr:hypothetical protein IWW34DRAFT_785089 [Fusarium oxysporum f. sp. albedinis]
MSDHENQAMAEVGDIANRIDALKIAGKKRRQPRKPLKEALCSYGEAADALSEHAANVVKLLRAGGLFNEEDLESVRTAQNRAIEFGRAARLLNDSATQTVVRQVISLGDKTFFNIDGLLQHFEKPIEKIAQGKIQGAQSGDILWKIAEECYHQATMPSGDLNLEDCLATSEVVEREEKKEHWIKFWIQSLCNCPGGPTIFQPENFVFSDSVNKPPKYMPRYLFRAYDDNSTGRNDKDVIASILSQCGEANRHGIDIFSMDYKEASQMLHQHLDKGPFSSSVTDNLVSWSSSLMFVIHHPGDICICAVDTSQFPRRQFARDKWLLNSFKDAEHSDQENNFRDLRLNRSEYDNGEYLSQGVLHIEERSCTLSLRRLKNTGLWDLYPEFNVNDVENDADVRVQWTKYVKLLRSLWHSVHTTTKANVHN